MSKLSKNTEYEDLKESLELKCEEIIQKSRSAEILEPCIQNIGILQTEIYAYKFLIHGLKQIVSTKEYELNLIN